jgi:hypothetical protein
VVWVQGIRRIFVRSVQEDLIFSGKN